MTRRKLIAAAVALVALAAAPTASAAPKIVARTFIGPGVGPMAYDSAHDTLWMVNMGPETDLLSIDPATLEITSSRPVDQQGQAFYSLAVGLGRIWVSNFPDDYEDHSIEASLSSYTADGTFIQTMPTYGHGSEGIAFLGGKVWVANHHQDLEGTGGSVVELDPDTGALLGRASVGQPMFCCGPQLLTAADGAVWTGVPNLNSVVRVDGDTLATTQIPVGNLHKYAQGGCGFLTADRAHHRMWVSDGGCSPSDIVRLNTQTGKVTQSFNIGGASPGMDYGFGALWVSWASSGRGRTGYVSRVDPDTGKATAKLATNGGPGEVAVVGDAILTETWGTGELLRIEP